MAKRPNAVGSGNRSAGGGHGVSKAVSNANTAKTKPKPLVPGAGVAKNVGNSVGFVAHALGTGIANTDKALANAAGKTIPGKAIKTVVGLGSTATKQAVKTVTNNSSAKKGKGVTTKKPKSSGNYSGGAFASSGGGQNHPSGATGGGGGGAFASSSGGQNRPAASKSYTVQKGDNLWNISKKQFGGTTNANVAKGTNSIWAANKGVVGKNGSIKPGDTLNF